MENIQLKKYISKAEDLEVFKKAYIVSIEVHKIALSLPKIEQYDLGSQMRRSSKSICANIGEGFTKQRIYPEEFKRFLLISVGSAGEIKIWLKYCLDLGYIDAETYKRLDNEYEQIIKMLAGLRDKVTS